MTILVRDTSNTFDPVVTLLDPDGFIVDQNDQHVGDYPGLDENDSAIEQTYIPSSGNYTVQVGDFFEENGGSFEMTIIRETS